MDQALKARLIGAVILVIVAVLVIPELLSGRKTDEAMGKAVAGSGDSRTITIELGAPEPQTTPPSPTPSQPQQWSIPPASPERPIEVATSERIADEPRDPDASTVERPTASVAPSTSVPGKTGMPPADTTAAPAPPPASPSVPGTVGGAPDRRASGRTWSVQVGAFGSPGSAQKLETELDGAGFPAYIATTKQSGKVLHRVRVGPVAERSEADRLAARLESRRLPVSVVAND